MNWMMNTVFTKEMVGNHHFHPFKTACLGYQAEQHFDLNFARPKDASLSRRGDHVAVSEDRSEPMENNIRKGQCPFMPCFCFGLTCHGEPDNWKKA